MTSEGNAFNRAQSRVAMTYEFENLLKRLQNKKELSENISEEERIEKLTKILNKSVESYKLKCKGNNATLKEFIDQEIGIKTPETINSCSLKVLNAGNALESELDLFDEITFEIDMDNDDPSQLNIDMSGKEKSRLTASVGASHDMTSLSQLNGEMSVGIRNIFGKGERLNISCNLGLGTTNEYNIYNIVNNVSNEYNISFYKPRIQLEYNPFKLINDNELYKTSFLTKIFQESIDRSKCSSYREHRLGNTTYLINSNNKHNLYFNYHLRSLIPSSRLSNIGNINPPSDAISPSVGDEQFPSVKSSIGYKYINDTRNHISIPSKGYLINFETEIAGCLLKTGDVDFIKTNGIFNYHLTLPFNNIKPILNIGIQCGFVIPWKRKLLNLTKNNKLINNLIIGNNKDSYVRIIDRIIPMAGLKLRGFEHAQIGPRDRNDYVHCDFLLSHGISLILPLYNWLYFNIFYNSTHCALIDNINTSKDLIDSGRISAGTSLLIPFPIGRFEIGYAHPIKTNDDPFTKMFWAFDVSFY
mmetsp:Transcript_90064/g.110231  ORF Transcript_90064/g.110231 Transcript_90064/m.110231 type:complete len:529 (-) Transcript_90064:117-1703(-)